MQTLIDLVSHPVFVIALVIIILFIIIMFAIWKSPHADEAIQVSGLKPRSLIGKGSLVIPILEKTCSISLESIPLKVELKESTSNGGLLVDVMGTALVKVAANPTSVALAVEQFCQGSQENTKKKIAESVTNVLIGQLRAIIATMTIDDIISDMESFSAKVMTGTKEDLDRMGLELLSYTLAKVETPSSRYLENKAIQQAAASKAEADIATAEKQKDTDVQTSKANREGKQAKLEAETQIAESEKEKQLKVEAYRGQQAEAKAQADAAGQLEEIRQRELISKQNEQLAVQAAATKEKELIETIIKPAEAEKQKQIVEAEAKSQQQIVNAEALARQSVIKAEAEAKAAESLAKQEVTKAEAVAKAIRLKAEAEAEAIKLKGNAEAEVIQSKGKAEAEAMQIKAEAYKQYGEAAMLDIIAQKLPSIADSVAKPLAAIDKVTVVGNGDNISSMSKAVLDGTTNVMEIIKSTTGLDPVDMIEKLTTSKMANNNKVNNEINVEDME